MKKSRKKILLSSIAMLLVALVALGSATFAWFTINRQVTAKDINVKAATSSGLVISNKQQAQWLTEVSFSEAGTSPTVLNPISYDAKVGQAMPTGYYPEDVENDGELKNGSASNFSSKDSLPTATDTTYTYGTNNYVALYQVQIKSSKDTAIDRSVTANISASGDGTSFAKAVLVDSSNKVVASYGDAYKAITDDTPTVSDTDFAATTSTQVLTSVAANTTYTYKLYVWYEGNDTDCKDTNQGKETNFTLNFTLGNA